MDRYRAAELKHGRVCMLASVGYIVQGLYHLPDGPFEATKPIDALIKVRFRINCLGGWVVRTYYTPTPYLYVY